VVSCQSTKRNFHNSFDVTASEITLTWEAASGSDTAGYKIYYKSDSPAPPYDGTELAEGNSPILVPLSKLKNPINPEFTIHGLSKNNTYFFVVTAYDIYGIESGFSDEILVRVAVGNKKN
jgi:hypothetical protein